jgi:hypothetical protein
MKVIVALMLARDWTENRIPLYPDHALVAEIAGMSHMESELLTRNGHDCFCGPRQSA